MFGLGDLIKMLSAAVTAGLVMYFVGHIAGVSSGKAQYELEARERAMALIQRKEKDDEEISRMDVQQLCAELGGKWMPNTSSCD